MRCVVIAFVVLLACSKRDATDVAAPAGKVLELAGTVSASRNGVARKLAVADTVFPDETIDTGSDGSVTIELTHNHARWAMEPGQKKRVDESAAWTLTAQGKPAEVVDHSTSAAGRNAERTAAENRSTESGGGPPAAEPAPVAPKAEREPLRQNQKKTGASDAPQPSGDDYEHRGVASAAGVAPRAADVLAGKRGELAACLRAGTKATIKIHIVEGKATALDADTRRKACLDAVLAQVALPAVDEDVSLDLAH